MATTAIRKDEGLGLAVAVALHAALLAVLVLRPTRHETIAPPERIEVTISEDVGLKSTAPNPSAQAAADVAPDLGEAAPDAALAPPEPEVQPSPLPPAPVPPAPPAPAPKPQPAPQPRPQPQRAPRPQAQAKPQPQAKPQAQAKPKPQAKAQPTAKPNASNPIDRIVSAPSRPAAKPAAKPAARPAAPAAAKPGTSAKPAANSAPKPSEKPGGSRIGKDFLSGMADAKSDQGKGTPAAEIGPAVKSALSAAITRQLKPHWQAPQGPEAEDLVTYLAFDLNADGSLAGTPKVVRQAGITDVNRNQASRHAEQAVRAVQLAAPFNLPDEYYTAWKHVSSFKFDKRLSQ